MKKIFTILIALLTVVGAKANILGEGNAYYGYNSTDIKSASAVTTGFYVIYNCDGSYLHQNSNGTVTTGANTPSDKSYVFQITVNSDNTVTIQALNGDYLTTSSSTAMGTTSESSSATKYTLGLLSNNLAFNTGDYHLNVYNRPQGTGGGSQFVLHTATIDKGITLTWNISYDNGTKTKQESETVAKGATVSAPSFDYTTITPATYTVAEDADDAVSVSATAEFSTPFDASTDYANATWYYWLGGSSQNKYLYYSSSETDIPMTTTKSTTDEYKWAFIGNPIDGYQIINKAVEGGHLYIDASTVNITGTSTQYPILSNENSTTWTLVKGNADNIFSFSIEAKANNSASTLYFNDFANNSKLGFWTASPVSGAGSRMKVEPLVTHTVTWNIKETESGETLTTGTSTVAEGGSVTFDASTCLSSTYAFTSYNNPTVSNVQANVQQTVIATFSTPFTASTDESVTYYYWKNANSKYYVYYDASTTSYLPMSQSSSNTTAYKWAFYGNPITGYTIKNKATGDSKYLYIATASNGAYPTMSDNSTTWPIVSSSGHNLTVDDVTKLFSFELNNVYVNDFQGAHKLSFWQDSPNADDGSNWIVEEAPENETADYTTLGTTLTTAKLYSLGDGLNQYSNGADLTTAIKSAQTIYDEQETNTDVSFQTSIDNAVTALNSAIAKLTLNTPETGTYLRVKGYSNNYITIGSTTGEYAHAQLSSDQNDNNIIFYSTDRYLIGYGTGFGLYNTYAVAPADATLNSFTFSEGQEIGKYQITSNFSGSKILFDNTANGAILDRNSIVNTDSPSKTDWTLEKVTELPITLHASGTEGNFYATACVPVAVTVTGATPYKVTGVSGGWATLDEIKGTVPAETPMVLIGKTESATLNVTSSTDVKPDDNILSGAVKATEVTTTTEDYYFGQLNSTPGFYKVSGLTSSIYITNRAYLTASAVGGSGSSKGFTFVFGDDDPTGISNATATDEIMENSVRYNLQGQRVDAGYKGIVIIGGKKYLIK